MTSNVYFNAMNPFLKGDEGEKEESIFWIFVLIVLKLLISWSRVVIAFQREDESEIDTIGIILIIDENAMLFCSYFNLKSTLLVLFNPHHILRRFLLLRGTSFMDWCHVSAVRQRIFRLCICISHCRKNKQYKNYMTKYVLSAAYAFLLYFPYFLQTWLQMSCL